MSDIFSGYEREYVELSASISRRTSSMASVDRSSRRSKLDEIESEIAEADALVRIYCEFLQILLYGHTHKLVMMTNK